MFHVYFKGFLIGVRDIEYYNYLDGVDLAKTSKDGVDLAKTSKDEN